MKVTKKLSALLLALALVVACAACGGGGSSTSTPAGSTSTPAGSTSTPAPSVELLEYDLLPDKPFDGTTLNYVANSPDNDQFNMLIKFTEEKFTPMTGITVVWDQGAWDGVLEKMITEAVSGSSTYDLFMVMDAWGPTLANYMVPLDDYVARDGIDWNDYPKPFQELAMMGTDNILGLPMRGHFMTMFYRTDIYEALDLEIPATWDDLIANCKTIQDSADYSGMYGLAMPYSTQTQQNLMPWYTFLYSNGGELFDENWKPVFNSPEAVAATEAFVGLLLEEGIVNPASVNWGENDARVSVCDGTSAHFMSWSWLLSRFSNPEYTVDEVLDNVGTFAVPAFKAGETPVTSVSEFCTGIHAASTQQDAAWEYVKFLGSAQIQIEVVSDPSDQVNTMASLSAMTSDEVNNLPGREGLWLIGAETLQSARIAPTIAEWPEISAIISEAVNRAALGGNVQTELDNAAASAESILKAAGYSI